jgi:hypothetical protein
MKDQCGRVSETMWKATALGKPREATTQRLDFFLPIGDLGCAPGTRARLAWLEPGVDWKWAVTRPERRQTPPPSASTLEAEQGVTAATVCHAGMSCTPMSDPKLTAQVCSACCYRASSWALGATLYFCGRLAALHTPFQRPE